MISPLASLRKLSLCGLLLALALGSVANAQHVRIVAANISSGNYQNYDPGHGARILQGIKPDICLIQEFNYLSNTPTQIRNFVNTTFGTEFEYFREGGAQIANGIISRYPILACSQWEDPQVGNRDFAWARIDIPGDKHLWAISVHLHSGGGVSSRQKEAVALINFIAANVPAEDYVVIGGDFNTDVRTEAALKTLGSVVLTANPQAADQNGNQGSNAGRAKPYDAVYVDSTLDTLQVPVVIGSTTFAHNATNRGAVIDTRVFSAKGTMADISPALSDDSKAPQMQHMAVVKDFYFEPEVPADPPHLEIVGSTVNFHATPAAVITFRSTVGATYEIEASSEIGQDSWSSLGEITATSTTTTVSIVTSGADATHFLDSQITTATSRFFRVARK